MPLANLACPKCGTTGAPGALRCPKCDTLLGTDETQALPDPADMEATQAVVDPVVHGTSGWTATGAAKGQSLASLMPGSIVGNRYEILRLLGEGGMGAVFQARDRELDRLVALKVIRPELADNSEILRMFKQELILARQVTHSNVIRIFDLGVADGLRFITMQFVEGRDLKTAVLENGKLTPAEAAAIMVQVCEGLAAAHKEKVVHRDLKPQNIMIDAQGHVLVMDFGLAHSTDASTAGEMLLGSPQYMSPEQASRSDIDARSDLFTVGIIFYELLIGSLPFEAETVKQALQQRIQQQAPAPIERDPSIPKGLNEIVVKCFVRNRDERYQSAADIVRDIQIWQGVLVPGNTRLYRRLMIAFAAALVLVAGGGVAFYLTRPIPPPKPVTALISDFANQTGEPVLNGTLEPLFGAALEAAPFINNYPRAQARTLVTQMQAGKSVLDESGARLVAQREGLNVVVSASISKSGSDYLVAVKAIDAITGNVVGQSQVKAGNKEKLLASIPALAQPVRKALGDRAPASKEAQAGETFTATSLEAAHEYSLGQDAQLTGKYDDAMKYYQRALALDANLARAYSGMAVIYRNRGEEDKAEENIKIALSKPGMSQRERYRIRGASYVIAGSYEHAADEYKVLLEQFPSDNAGHANLAIAYLYLRNLPRSVEEGRKAIEIYPKNVAQRNNLASYLLYAGKFDEAVKEAGEVIKMNPAFERAYVVKALAALASGKPEQAAAAYEQAGKASARGASLRAMGLADIALMQGRSADALPLLQAGIKADLAAGQPARAAGKQVLLAQLQLQSGQRAAAISTAQQALAGTRDAEILQLAARIAVEAGQITVAREVARLLSKRLDSEPQGFAKLIEGEIALKEGDASGAIRIMREAQKLVDTWIGRFDLGRAYLVAEGFTEADAEFDACIRRRGEAASLTLDLLPTYSYLPAAYYYAGRAQLGNGSPTAAESFKTFLTIKSHAASDPMVTDARKRLGR